MGTLSPTHWFVIAMLFIVLFGAKRLPDAARSMGRSLRILKSEMHEMNAEGEQAHSAAEPVSHPSPAQIAQPDPTVGSATELRQSRAS
ncbi:MULTISPECIES: Sec-independent protein translocase subunit TatA [unclassified Nocardia]|uniref:Sec-independent protein translocase subunit TatA n=1 Tax=unclassified Nocardia TaxID=2637762 RepID=UPI0035E1922B